MNQAKLLLKKLDYKRIIWTLCVIGLCCIDVLRSTMDGYVWAAAVSAIGIAMFPLVALRFRVNEFLKWRYLIWIVLCGAGAYPAFCLLRPQTSDFNLSVILVLVGVLLYGFIMINLLTRNKLPGEGSFSVKNRNIFFILWFVMMAFCTVSVNEAMWPLGFLIIFLGFYLAPGDENTIDAIMNSVCDGIIISFFIVQIHAFLYRPYDQTRYVGMYTNSNVNAMFYLVTYVALLAKMTAERKNIAKKDGKKAKWLWYCILFLLQASQWAFTLFTLGRTVLLALFIITVIYWVIETFYIHKKRFLVFLRNGLIQFAVFIICIPLVWVCIRYIPALRHHPVWFGQEAYSEDRIHSWDPYNSEKYTSAEDLVDDFIFRLFIKKDDEGESKKKGLSRAQKSLVLAKTKLENVAPPSDFDTHEIAAISESNKERVIAYEDGVVPGTDSNHPVFSYVEYSKYDSIMGIRKYVYKYFVSGLNMFGHETPYPNVWITTDFYAYHCHNAFLQIAYCFGIIPGILLLIIPISVVVYASRLFKKSGDKVPWYMIFVMFAQLAFWIDGIFECDVFTGKMIFTLFFISLLPIMRIKKIEGK